jgi:predicted amidohydrolase
MAIIPWTATCIQMPANSLQDAKSRPEAQESILKCIDAGEKLVQLAVERDARDLILFPEFVFSGGSGPNLVGVVEWLGPEIERLQAMAARYRIFIGANLYTLSDDFPNRYLNTNFLFDRSGNVALKAYRLHTYHSSSPHDYWDHFIDKVGIDGAFPVARTELGNISMAASMELMFPEFIRAHVLRGAEVILHTTAEQIVDESVKRTRASENLAYLICANESGRRGTDRWMNVGSRIINPRGQVIAEVDQGVVGQCTGLIDVEGLRRRRANLDLGYPPYGANYLSRFRAEMFRDIYNQASFYPPNTYVESGAMERILPEKSELKLKRGRKQMVAAGMLPPEYDQPDA